VGAERGKPPAPEALKHWQGKDKDREAEARAGPGDIVLEK